MPLAPAPPADEVLLYCMHHAGGSAAAYRPWRPLLHPTVTLRPIELPGHAGRFREPLVPDLRQLAMEILGSLAEASGKPFVLFGHSMGAVLGLEICALLERHGMAPPALLIVSGCPAPHARLRRDRHRLDSAGLLALMRKLGGTQEALLENDELMKLMLPVLRNDLQCVECYDPGPVRLRCPIAVLGGSFDEDVPLSGLQGWEVHAPAPPEVRLFDGGHFFIETHRLEVVAAVNELLLRHVLRSRVGIRRATARR